MKIKRLIALLLAGAMLFILGACKQKEREEASSSEPQEVIDPNYPVAIGEIRIAEKPEAIVSLSPALTEIIYELGAEDRLVGVSDFCDYPDAAKALTRCGTPQLPNMEEIKMAAPQVVFASSTLSQEDTVELQQMGAEVVVLPRADSIDALEEIYVTTATILDGLVDGDENGVAVFAPLRAEYQALRYAADGIPDRLSGIYLRMTPLTMATGDTFEGQLLKEIGMNNAAADYSGWIYPEDKAVDLYPVIIFYDQSIDPQYFKDTKIYNTTDAVKKEMLFAVDATAFERQSARMFDELTRIFKAMYPDVEVVSGSGGTQENPEESDELQADAESASAEEEEVLDLEDATQIK